MTSQQFCTFLLDGDLFGVPVPQVQEIIGFHEMTRVPLAHDAVEGMINLRGQIVVAIDLRRRLSLGERAQRNPCPLMWWCARSMEWSAFWWTKSARLSKWSSPVLKLLPKSCAERCAR